MKTAAILRVLHIHGTPAARIEGLVIRDCDFRGVKQADVSFENVRLQPVAR